MEIRAMKAKGSPIRTRHKVTLSRNATCLQNLMVWDPMKTKKPVLTQQLSEEDLKKIVETPMKLGRYPVHGQGGVGRCVREVTVAPKTVFRQDRRRLAHREKIGGAVKSKKDHAMICQGRSQGGRGKLTMAP